MVNSACRLWVECTQAVLQVRAQRLPARPEEDKASLLLRPHHAGEGPQHPEAHGGGFLHPGDRSERFVCLGEQRAQQNEAELNYMLS